MLMRNSRNVARCIKYDGIEMPNLWIATKCYISITDLSCLIHQMLLNTEAETSECYEMSCKLI